MSNELYFIVKGQIRNEKDLCDNMARMLSHAWRAGRINERSFETDDHPTSRLFFKHLVTRNINAAADHILNRQLRENRPQFFQPRNEKPLRYFPHINPDRAHSGWIAQSLEDNSENRLAIGVAGMLLLESAVKRELAGACPASLVSNDFDSPVFLAGRDLFEYCVFLDQDSDLRSLARDTIFAYWRDYIERQSPSTNERWWVFNSDPGTGAFIAWTKNEEQNRSSSFFFIFPPSSSDAHYLVCCSRESHKTQNPPAPLMRVGRHKDSRQACDAVVEALLPRLSSSKKPAPRCS